MVRARLRKIVESLSNYILFLSARFSYCRGGSGGLMQVELRIRDTASRDRLRAYVERRLRFALSRFGNRVGRVVVRMGRLNGVQGIDEISWPHRGPLGAVRNLGSEGDRYGLVCCDRSRRRARRTISGSSPGAGSRVENLDGVSTNERTPGPGRGWGEQMAMEITVTLAKALVTQENLERLQGFLDSGKSFRDRDRTHLEVLSQKLDSLEVVPTDEIPRDVVTMNSQVAVTDLDAGRLSIYTLVFPGSGDISKGKVSVL